jgi:hypothetical protein
LTILPTFRPRLVPIPGLSCGIGANWNEQA